MNDIPIEDILSSKGRVKILKIMVKLGELNISEIAKKAELNYTTTLQHLTTLEKAQLVYEKHFGRIRIYKFRRDNSKAIAIKNLIEFWESNKP
jgi:DNA-binding transcriptional ArsR family regulator